MIECEFGYTDCVNLDVKCYMCPNALHYVPKKQKSKGLQKKISSAETKRQGSISEVKNHNQNKQALTAATSATPNSGAGKVKGDEQIRGLISIMEEIKTTTRKNLNKEPGKESFTLQKEWLTKIDREAREAGMEFWYVKWSFKEFDEKFYITVDQDVVMDMVVTMVHDRKEAKLAQAKIDVAERRARTIEAENILLKAQIDELKAKLALCELEKGE